MNSLVRVKVHQAVEGQYLRDTCANRNNQIPIADMGTTSANGKPNGRQPIRHGVTDLKKNMPLKIVSFPIKDHIFALLRTGRTPVNFQIRLRTKARKFRYIRFNEARQFCYIRFNEARQFCYIRFSERWNGVLDSQLGNEMHSEIQ